MSNQEEKILFFKGLHWYGAIAQCLPWAREIHIDEDYRNHPYLHKIIEHERKHQEIFDRARTTKSRIKTVALILYENFWNMASCYKLHYRVSKEDWVFETIMYVGFPIVLATKLLGVW
jgi:hypothetical protein